MAFIVSTQTYIIYTDVESFELERMFNNAAISDKILGLKLGTNGKGTYTSTTSLSKNYLRCLTMSVSLDGKPVSVKIFPNGTVQLTGCKGEHHAVECINLLFETAGLTKETTCRMQSVMLNVTMHTPYNIDRMSLGQYIYDVEKVNVPPFSIDSIGLKLKLPIGSPVEIVNYKWTPEEGAKRVSVESGDLITSRSTSVSIFQNGKITMSSVNETVIRNAIEWIFKVLEKSKSEVTVSKPSSFY